MTVRPAYVWGGLFLAGTAYEVYGLSVDGEGYTLSEVTRALFRVDSKPGRTLFVGAWLGLSVWLVPHIAFKAVEAAVDMVVECVTADCPGCGRACSARHKVS